MESEIISALKKRALGYEAQEVTEEYSSSEEGVKMVKRKVVLKPVPPDVTAVKILMELEGDKNVTSLTDEELELEKQRLISLFIKEEK